VPRHRPVAGRGRAFGDHHLRGDVSPGRLAGAGPRHAQRASGAHASHQFAIESSAGLPGCLLGADDSAVRWWVHVEALRRTSREIVDGLRPRRRAISRPPKPYTRQIAMSSRSEHDRWRPDTVGGRHGSLHQRGGTSEMQRAMTRRLRRRFLGLHPPAIAAQNRTRSSRQARGSDPDRAEQIAVVPEHACATSVIEVLGRLVESGLVMTVTAAELVAFGDVRDVDGPATGTGDLIGPAESDQELPAPLLTAEAVDVLQNLDTLGARTSLRVAI
jgi:hypothetical protein